MFVGVLLMARFFMRTNIMCDFCQDSDCKVWDRVPEEIQQKILAYFRTHEGREPDTKAPPASMSAPWPPSSCSPSPWASRLPKPSRFPPSSTG